MSMVYILHHDENIYNCEKKSERVVQTQAKYTSIYHNKVNKTSKAVTVCGSMRLLSSDPKAKASHRTMGRAETPISTPCEYLKRNCGISFKRTPNHKCICGNMPPVPAHDDQLELKPRLCKRFIKINIEKAKNLTPKRRVLEYCDTRTGEKHLVCPSGLLPAYIFSPNFGKIPKYLEKVDNAIKPKGDDQKQDEKMPDGLMKLTSNDRMQLLNGLKKNWAERHKTFQALPVSTDTEMKKIRKSMLAKELQQLEKDILLIENNPMIYVCTERE